eukprot:UN13962
MLATVEKVIEDELHERIANFDMVAFMQEMPCRKDEISEEIFEMLLSFTDFVMFKELMLDHKSVTRRGKLLICPLVSLLHLLRVET